MDRDAELSALATLEKLTQLLPSPIGILAGLGVQLARAALENQADPVAHMEAMIAATLQAEAQAQARAKWGGGG